MEEIKVFSNSEFGEVRTIVVDGDPWFVGKDVAEILGYAKPLNALANHVDEDDSLKQGLIDGMGRVQETIIINESGLYSLILSSKLPTAKKFKRWVTSDVLPSLRRNGGYIVNQEGISPEELMAKALQVANKTLEERQRRIDSLEVANSRLMVEKEISAPKVAYFNELVDRNLLTNFRDTAKELKIKQSEFVHFLIAKKYIYRDAKGRLLPYAKHIEDGIFEMKETFNEKTSWRGTQTMLTPKGRETFRLLMLGKG